MKLQKHHIVPDYICKELGLTTSYKVDGVEFYFKENIVKITKLQHANIHWGYWLKDLSPLLEVCSPPQWVIDMIPLGDKRDLSSAKLLAEGEIDGIDTSGENHHFFGKKRPEHSKIMSAIMNGRDNPNFKHGNYVGMRSPDKEVRKRAIKKRDAISYANNRDERIAQSREYYANNRDERIAYQKENYAKNKDKILAKRRAKRQREKQQRDKGIGALPIM